MSQLVVGLANREDKKNAGLLIVIDSQDFNEQNHYPKSDIATIKAKNWVVYDYNGGSNNRILLSL